MCVLPCWASSDTPRPQQIGGSKAGDSPRPLVLQVKCRSEEPQILALTLGVVTSVSCLISLSLLEQILQNLWSEQRPWSAETGCVPVTCDLEPPLRPL